MKNSIFFMFSLFLSLISYGCDNAAEMRLQNSQNITKINVGMTKAEVLQIMGNKTAHKDSITITNPFKTALRQSDGNTYEILYYYTHYLQHDYPFKSFIVRESELTPIIFQDGKVIGWGSDFLARTFPSEITPRSRRQ